MFSFFFFAVVNELLGTISALNVSYLQPHYDAFNTEFLFQLII